MKVCQMTISWGEFGKNSGWKVYDRCGKKAKFKVPKPKQGIEYVCGIHANSLRAMYKRVGQEDNLIPLSEGQHE